MRIAFTYSHLNGLEYIQVHKPALLAEIRSIIEGVAAEECRTKVSKEKRRNSTLLFAPKVLNEAMLKGFNALGWRESRTSYWVTSDAQLIRKTMQLPALEQKHAIEAAGLEALSSYNQTDFVKERVAVEVQFGKYAFVAYDLFVKHMAFYVGDQIDVGIEVLPTKSFAQQMSSGIGYYEGELYNLVRQGRGVPAVPLVLFGVDA